MLFSSLEKDLVLFWKSTFFLSAFFLFLFNLYNYPKHYDKDNYRYHLFKISFFKTNLNNLVMQQFVDYLVQKFNKFYVAQTKNFLNNAIH